MSRGPPSMSGRHDSKVLMIGMAGAIGTVFMFAVGIWVLGCASFRRYHADRFRRRKFVNENIPWKKYKSSRRKSDGDLTSEPTRTMGEDSKQEIPEAPLPEDDDECSICLAPFKKGDKISWSSNAECCSHTFHKKCIQVWLYNHADCPMCREVFLKEESEDEGGEGMGSSDSHRDEETGSDAIDMQHPDAPSPTAVDDDDDSEQSA